jgi:hypothetical protein
MPRSQGMPLQGYKDSMDTHYKFLIHTNHDSKQ